MGEETKALRLIAIQVGDTYLVSHPETDRYRRKTLEEYLFDGFYGTETFNKYWLRLSKLPERVVQMVKQPSINYRYELIEPSMASEPAVPAVLARDEVAEYVDYEWVWKKDWAHLQSLYKLLCDEQPDVEEDVPHTIMVVLELGELQAPVDFQFPYVSSDSGARRDDVMVATADGVERQMIGRILWPDVVQHLTPCRLSSKRSYEIVRHYVQTHIDSRYAEITSDYAFCFTVKKRIDLAETYMGKFTTIFAKKPKTTERLVTDRKVQVFEMTWSPECYKNYTPLPGFMGKDLEDLRAKIQKFLDDLMARINEPLVECQCCSGRGVVEESSQDKEE